MDRPSHTHAFRSAVYSTRGMCATSQPLATLTGIEILKKGGTAADAGIGMLATLSVVEPFMNGLGGDMFALYFDAKERKLHGLNSSGQAPEKLNVEFVLSKGYQQMPESGPLTITVPGALAGYYSIYEKFGKLSWEYLFQDAIQYAKNGFPVTEIIAYEWNSKKELLQKYHETAALYLPGGKAPKPGDVFINAPLFHTLSKIAKNGIGSFYRGAICDQICNAMQNHGALLTVDDMASFSPTWVNPIFMNYKGRDVFELPPNCQGITVLEMLNLLKDYNVEEMGINSSEYIHLMVEAKKFSFSDRDTKIGDPNFRKEDLSWLYGPMHSDRFRKQFNPLLSSGHRHESFPSNTVYAVAVDENRNVASFISSIFELFGSGIVAGKSGILLQNRGSAFVLDENHPNGLEPGKRPLHTIIPSMVFKNDLPEFAFGVMGGHMQPQGHVQILNNIYRFGLGVQEAADAPRFFHDGKVLFLESGISSQVKRALIKMKHNIGYDVDVFGGYQGIWIDRSSGILAGGSDLRKDGCAIGY